MIKKIWNLLLLLSFVFIVTSCSKKIEPSVNEDSDYTRYMDLLKAFDLSSIEFEYADKTITFYDKNLTKYKIECNDYSIIEDGSNRLLSLSNSDFFEIDDFVFEYFEHEFEYVKTISKDLIKNNTTVKVVNGKYQLKTSYATFRINDSKKDKITFLNLDTNIQATMSLIDGHKLDYSLLKNSSNTSVFMSLSGYELYTNKESNFNLFANQMSEQSNYFLNMELNVNNENIDIALDYKTSSVMYNATTSSTSKGKNVYSCISKTEEAQKNFETKRYVENEFKIISATEVFSPSGNSVKKYKIKLDTFLCFDFDYTIKQNDYVIKSRYKTIGISKDVEGDVEVSLDNPARYIQKTNIKNIIVGYIEITKAKERWIILLNGSSFPLDIDTTLNKKLNNFLLNHNYMLLIYGGSNEI